MIITEAIPSPIIPLLLARLYHKQVPKAQISRGELVQLCLAIQNWNSTGKIENEKEKTEEEPEMIEEEKGKTEEEPEMIEEEIGKREDETGKIEEEAEMIEEETQE